MDNHYLTLTGMNPNSTIIGSDNLVLITIPKMAKVTWLSTEMMAGGMIALENMLAHKLADAKTKSVAKEGENNKQYNCVIHIFAIFCLTKFHVFYCF